MPCKKHKWKQIPGGKECVKCEVKMMDHLPEIFRRTADGSKAPDPPPILTKGKGAGVIEDATGKVTRADFLDGAVSMEIDRRFDQEHMLRVWWESLTRKNREDLWPLVQGVADADAWVGALRPAYGEWMRARRARGQEDERPPEPTHSGSDGVQ